MIRVSEAVRERAEELARAAHLPIDSIRFESTYGRGLRVIAGKATNVQVVCGLILVYRGDDGGWDLAENNPPKATMTERDKRWS